MAWQDRGPIELQKDKKKKGFLLDQVSTGGGIAGALGGGATGAAIGTAIFPGAGTAVGGLLGALIGGGLGSAGGEATENAITGDDLGKNVLQEGLIGGVTSLPIGAGLKLARAGAQAATGLGKTSASELVRQAGAQTVGKGTAKKYGLELGSKATAGGRAADLGSDLQRRAANTSKVSDSYTQELGIVDALNRNGLTGSASNMYKNLDSTLGDLSGQIQTQLSTITRTVPRANVIKGLQKRVTDSLPDDPTFARELTRSLERLNKSGSGKVTASELFSFKQDLSSRLSPAFKKMDRGAPLTAKEEVDMALWRSLDDDIAKIAPGVKDLTMDQSRLITARPGLQTASNKTAGIPLLGIKSQKLEQGIQATQNRAGRALAGAAGASAATAGQGIVPLTLRQGLGRMVVPSAETEDPTLDGALATAGQTPFMGDMSLDQGMVEQPAATNPLGYSSMELSQALMAALAAGDTDAAEQLGSMYELAAAYEASATEAEKPLSAEASKVVGNANSGLQSLDQLEALISGEGGVPKGTLVPGRDLFGGAVGNALGTSQFDTVNRNIIDVITRLRTGAALTDQEARFYASQVPQAFDTPDVIQLKLQTFRDLFNSVATRTGSAGTDLQASTAAY